MNWHSEWASIASRIEGLLNAAQFFVHTLKINSEDEYGVAQYFAVEASDVVNTLSSFLEANKGSIPQGAADALNRFLTNHKPSFSSPNVKGLSGLKFRVPLLAALRAEIEYYLSDFEAVSSKKTERAFLHLQRSIVVDDSVRDKWQKAFESKELECEKLGAVHLLLHGIWAFKVDAMGGRTDLVFSDPITDMTKISRVADALVLTEWKLVKEPNKVEERAEEARKQIQLYTAGALGGIELSYYRYVILVSSQQLCPLEDTQIGSSICKHLNIAVSPKTPSSASRT